MSPAALAQAVPRAAAAACRHHRAGSRLAVAAASAPPPEVPTARRPSPRVFPPAGSARRSSLAAPQIAAGLGGARPSEPRRRTEGQGLGRQCAAAAAHQSAVVVMASAAAEDVPSLVTVDWLKANIGSVKLLDGTWYMPNANKSPVDEFQAERIPGSSLFLTDEIADKTAGLPHMLPSPGVFGSAVAAMGITTDTHVVVYDRTGVFSAPRVWWTFRVMGHAKVSVLDGGLPAWKAAGGETDTSPVPEADTVKAGLLPDVGGSSGYQACKDSSKVRSLQQVWDNVEVKAEQVVDARSSGRFYGTAPEPRAGMRGGHIPGSKSVPFDSVLKEGMAGMKTPEEIRKAFQGVDLSSGKPLVASCGSGMTACVLALALDQIGQPLTNVYDGSWMEWGTNQDVPVVTED